VTAPPLRVGTRLFAGAYVLEELADQDGESGLLYRARHRDGGLRALRCLPRDPDPSEESSRRFETEIRRLATLSHPAIPRVYDHFEHDGYPFFSMDWLPGQRATDLLAGGDGNWSYERLRDLALQLAQILDYLHRRDPAVLHRDVRPTNLLVTPSQQLYLVGFRVARAFSRKARDTMPFATAAYSPPEQINPAAPATTPRSDVFSFGWTIGHLATGCAPDSKAIAKSPKRLEARLKAVLPEDAEGFIDVLLRCIRLAPKQRYADGRALLTALREAAGATKAGRGGKRCKVCKARVPKHTRYFCETCGTRRTVSSTDPRSRPCDVQARLTAPAAGRVTEFAKASKAEPLDHRLAALVGKLARIDCSGDFDRLLADSVLCFDPLPHQREAVLDVLRHKKGQALLADEVGLGKTIEALYVLAEYQQRGLVRRTLILTPPTLTHQWREELKDKLGFTADQIHMMDTAASTTVTRRSLKEKPVSIGVVRRRGRQPYKPELFKGIEFDLVIVDEVHSTLSQARSKVKPRPLKSYQLVQGIHKKFVLLLSATPIQNTVVDLYELVNLTKPGKLLSWKDFESRYIESYEVRRDGTKFPKIRRGRHLGQLLSDVVIRHTRSQVMTSGAFPRRKAYTPNLRLSSQEQDLYEAVRRRISEQDLAARRPVWCLDTAGAICAHPRSFVRKVRGRFGWDDLVRQAEALPAPTKLVHLQQAVSKFVSEGHDKVLVFSAYDEARQEIAKTIGKQYRTYTFRRGDSNDRRLELLRQFGRDGTVLVVDDSAAVGLNLQFCDVLINYDLPWNPFLIEQRIGRIQRIGQRSQHVWIVNFLVKDTIDEIKLDVCQARLRMFEGVFGEAPTILGALDDEDMSLESVYRDIYLESDAAKKRAQIQKLTEEIERARQRMTTEEGASRTFFDQCGWED
jgi:superfamily II DNA or RNA helicase